MAYSASADTYSDPYRMDDVVYFTGDTSSESWAGVIGDEHDMTDNQVNDYIKNTKPELYVKLHGMRFRSSDVPMTFKPMRDLRRLFGMLTERQDRDRDLTSQQHTNSPYVGSSAEGDRGRTLSYAEPFRNKSQRHDFREKELEQNQDQLKLDGVAQKVVLSAAERLYPKIEPAKTAPLSFRDKNTEPDQAFKYPPNSKQAYDRRALKQFEINETLAQVHKYEKALKAAKSQLRHLEIRSPSPDASVLITRPFYMESREDRYKKQGLTPYDREKYNKAVRQDSLVSNPIPVKDTSKELLFCYCREPENDREMVRCSKKWCPVGWFHLQCTGLDRLPFLNEEFHCCYCSDGLGPLVSDEFLDRRPYHGTAVAGKLVESVVQHYLDNEIETEVVFEECGPGQARTNTPTRISIYDNEDEEEEEGNGIGSDVTDDESWAAEEYARLHDKVVKWRAVNDPYKRNNVYGGELAPTDNRTSTTSSTTSFFNNKSNDSQNSEDGVDVSSDNATIRASSPAASMSELTTSLNNNKENLTAGFYNQEDKEMTEYGTTASDSAEDGDDEDESIPPKFAYHNHHTINARNLTSNSNSRSTATTQLTYPLQPSTITDTTRARATNTQQSSSFFTSQPLLPPLFSSFSNQPTGPRTPSLAPQVSPGRSKKPWGTPVNIKDFKLDYDFHFDYPVVAEPVSPSPDKKRKFVEVDDEVGDNRYGGLGDIGGGGGEDGAEEEQEVNNRYGDDEYKNRNGSDDDVEEEEEENGELVTFMLDSQAC